eukprot:Nitzschia sp. Nitz4//scaffold274_size25273//10710//12764//NITZ4_008328-RA/size25273-processed-gene-0.8-mRNA-1//1//CDS//3329545284//8502//frame0
MMDSTSSALLSHSSESPSTPNWRVISGDDDAISHLSERPLWSDKQFQESLLLYDQFMKCSDTYVSHGIKKALNALDHAYRLYGPASVVCSFNGGKDAVVILHLIRAAHANYFKSSNPDGLPMIRPRVIYFDHVDEFPEVKEFLHSNVEQYDLDMVAFATGIQFSEGLSALVKSNFLHGSQIPFPMAFVLGTRDSDPNAAGQDEFAPSSHWMPPFMRVNPILSWNYGHVWHFLRLFHLPYCTLYDQGYTSLGTTKNSKPCPALKVLCGKNASHLPKYWPAYMLRDWEQERAGRFKPHSKDKTEVSSSSKPPASNHTSTTASVADCSSALSIAGQLESRSTVASVEDSSSNVNTSESIGGLDDSTIFSLDGNCDGLSTGEKTVGILIIGDEILKGMTLDQNTIAAAQALRKECVKLRRVVVVSDNEGEIVKDIRRLQDEVDVIITSGGVGPTHDDVTIKSVALALDRELVFHDEMAKLLQSKMNQVVDLPLTHAQRKMATLPSNAKLRYLSEELDDWPVLQCRNIFVLPGVPEFFNKTIQNVASYLSSQLERGAAYKVVLGVDEPSIVDVLNNVVSEHPNVSFGSYPFVGHPEFKTVLTLEGLMIPDTPARQDGDGDEDNVGSENKPLNRRNLLRFNNSGIFEPSMTVVPKGVRDEYVISALDDLLTKLPSGSILRVENDDLTPFS